MCVMKKATMKAATRGLENLLGFGGSFTSKDVRMDEITEVTNSAVAPTLGNDTKRHTADSPNIIANHALNENTF